MTIWSRYIVYGYFLHKGMLWPCGIACGHLAYFSVVVCLGQVKSGNPGWPIQSFCLSTQVELLTLLRLHDRKKTRWPTFVRMSFVHSELFFLLAVD
jgi:hypothetical protein